MEGKADPRKSYAPSVRSRYLRERWSRFANPPALLSPIHRFLGKGGRGDETVTGLVIVSMSVLWPLFVLLDTGFYLRTAMAPTYSRRRKSESVPTLVMLVLGALLGRGFAELASRTFAPADLAESAVWAYMAAIGLHAGLWPSCYGTETRGSSVWRLLFAFTGGASLALVHALAFSSLGDAPYARAIHAATMLIYPSVIAYEALKTVVHSTGPAVDTGA
jgi:hypothetical protein